jgi:hypothetical protein
MTSPKGRLASSLEQKHDFIFKAGKVLPALVNRSVTRVMGVPIDGGPFEHRGTALLCAIKGQQAIVTANHVLTEMEKEGRFSATAFSCMTQGRQSTIFRFVDIDVAVFFPEKPIDIRDEIRFWPAEASDESCALLAEDYALLQGYPVRFARFLALGPAYVSQAYTHCTSIRLKESDLPEEAREFVKEQVPEYPLIPDGILKPCQVALNYAEDTGPLKTLEGEEVTKKSILDDHSALYRDGPAFPGQKPWGPFGLSGSPAWRFGAYGCDWNVERWSPDLARLMGIVTHWNEAHQILVVTPFAEVLSRLERAR